MELGLAEREFLDGVDSVLNSNTFLLTAAVPSTSKPTDAGRIRAFIASAGFSRALLRQDREREWDLFHEWNAAMTDRVPVPLPLVRPAEPRPRAMSESEARALLVSMLTGGGIRGFRSPYRKELDIDVARNLTGALLATLLRGQPGRFYALDLGFLFPHGADGAGYLDGAGSDTATAILTDSQTSILLTNGMA